MKKSNQEVQLTMTNFQSVIYPVRIRVYECTIPFLVD